MFNFICGCIVGAVIATVGVSGIMRTAEATVVTAAHTAKQVLH